MESSLLNSESPHNKPQRVLPFLHTSQSPSSISQKALHTHIKHPCYTTEGHPFTPQKPILRTSFINPYITWRAVVTYYTPPFYTTFTIQITHLHTQRPLLLNLILSFLFMLEFPTYPPQKYLSTALRVYITLTKREHFLSTTFNYPLYKSQRGFHTNLRMPFHQTSNLKKCYLCTSGSLHKSPKSPLYSLPKAKTTKL